MTIDMMRNDRSPSHRKPKLPPMADLAARLRAGEQLEDLAAEYDRNPGTIRVKLNNAKAKLRGKPAPAPKGFEKFQKPGTSQEYPCTDEGCDRVFDTAQGARMHHTRTHRQEQSA